MIYMMAIPVTYNTFETVTILSAILVLHSTAFGLDDVINVPLLQFWGFDDFSFVIDLPIC